MMAGRVIFAFVSCLLLLIATRDADGADAHGVAGPFNVIPEHIEMCPGHMVDLPGWNVTFKLSRDRTNVHRFFVSFNATLPFISDDNQNPRLEFASWSSRGGWKEHALRMDFKRMCTSGKTYVPRMWHAVMNSVFGDPNHDCPVPPGSYEGKSFASDLDQEIRNVPVFFYGKFRADCSVWHRITRKVGACLRIYVNIVPKRH